MPNIFNRYANSEKKIHQSKSSKGTCVVKSSTNLNHINTKLSTLTLDLFKFKECHIDQLNKSEEVNPEISLDNQLKCEDLENIKLPKSLSKSHFITKSKKKVIKMGFKKLQHSSEGLDPIYLRNRYENLKSNKDNLKSGEKSKKVNYVNSKSREKEITNKIKLVDIYYYDKKKWEEQNQPKQDKSLQNLLVRKSTISYLNEMMGEWGSKGKSKK